MDHDISIIRFFNINILFLIFLNKKRKIWCHTHKWKFLTKPFKTVVAIHTSDNSTPARRQSTAPPRLGYWINFIFRTHFFVCKFCTLNDQKVYFLISSNDDDDVSTLRELTRWRHWRPPAHILMVSGHGRKETKKNGRIFKLL